MCNFVEFEDEACMGDDGLFDGSSSIYGWVHACIDLPDHMQVCILYTLGPRIEADAKSKYAMTIKLQGVYVL